MCAFVRWTKTTSKYCHCTVKETNGTFLDEPTSGLDAAAASNIMQEITRVAKEENLIVVCTIHQPSTKVYHGFDKVMILSRGREAFTGTAIPDATDYFARIGYPLPAETNPAEHFLDLVNSDFLGSKEVDNILDTWQQQKQEQECQEVVDDEDDVLFARENHPPIAPYLQELSLMFRRHFRLVARDPILYLGRCAVFFAMGTIFSLVYWNARELDLDQVYSKLWVQLWFSAVPAQSKYCGSGRTPIDWYMSRLTHRPCAKR
jgi:hypothetical protein